jgi:hypothetical protein
MPGAAGDDYMSRVSSRRTTSFLVATRKDAKKRSPDSSPRSGKALRGSLALLSPQGVLRRHIPVPAENAGVLARPLRARISAARFARLE